MENKKLVKGMIPSIKFKITILFFTLIIFIYFWFSSSGYSEYSGYLAYPENNQEKPQENIVPLVNETSEEDTEETSNHNLAQNSFEPKENTSSPIKLKSNSGGSGKKPLRKKEMKRVIARTAKAEDRASFKKQGCKIIHELIDMTAMSCPKGIAKKHEPDKIYHILGSESNQQVHILGSESNQQINVDDVHSLGYTGEGITIAVLGTGVDTDHPELNTSIVGGRCFVTSPTPCTSPEDYEDYHGQGTHVAGAITADGINPDAKGVAPDAKIWVGRVCDGSCFSSDIAAGIEYVVLGPDGILNTGDEPAKILSISVGGAGDPGGPHCDGEVVPDKANWAVDNGVTVIAASGRWNDRVTEPACASKVIAVGAVSKTDVRWVSSGTGVALDMMGPGVNIYTTGLGGGYSSGTGTSMATSHVSGVVALLKQANSSLNDTEIKNALYNTAVDLEDPGWDNTTGWGRVDALAAFLSANSVRDVGVVNVTLSSHAVYQGEEVLVYVRVISKSTVNETFVVRTYYNETEMRPARVQFYLVPYPVPPVYAAVGFRWPTTNVPPGTYVIKSNASIVPEEITDENMTDNEYIDGIITILDPSVEVNTTLESMNCEFLVNANETRCVFRNSTTTNISGLSYNFTVTVKDQYDNPLVNAPVSWDLQGDTNFTLDWYDSLTDINGIARAQVSANSNPYNATAILHVSSYDATDFANLTKIVGCVHVIVVYENGTRVIEASVMIINATSDVVAEGETIGGEISFCNDLDIFPNSQYVALALAPDGKTGSEDIYTDYTASASVEVTVT